MHLRFNGIRAISQSQSAICNLQLTRSPRSGLMKAAHGRSDRTRHSALRTHRHSAPGTRHRHSAPSTRHSAPGTPAARPLLKWAGGKRQLLPALRAFYPESFGRYFEPFVGSGAVFFDLYASGRLAGARATLTDCNADLIGCYRVVRDRTPRGAARAGAPGARARDRRRRALLRGARAIQPHARPAGRRDDVVDGYTPALAAMLIYLNRTGFNGLFRLNAAGHFNVPGGPLRAAADLRPGAPGGRRRGAWRPRRQPEPGAVRVGAWARPAPAIWCTSIRRTRR